MSLLLVKNKIQFKVGRTSTGNSVYVNRGALSDCSFLKCYANKATHNEGTKFLWSELFSGS